jgi:hypothetical protein
LSPGNVQQVEFHFEESPKLLEDVKEFMSGFVTVSLPVFRQELRYTNREINKWMGK